jgi:hypothetical protein
MVATRAHPAYVTMPARKGERVKDTFYRRAKDGRIVFWNGLNCFCEHKKQRSRCREAACGGGQSLCTHGRFKSLCKDCGITSQLYCQVHKKYRNVCKECKALGSGGSGICDHSKRRTRCKQCQDDPGVPSRQTRGPYRKRQPMAESRPETDGVEEGQVGDVVMMAPDEANARSATIAAAVEAAKTAATATAAVVAAAAAAHLHTDTVRASAWPMSLCTPQESSDHAVQGG